MDLRLPVKTQSRQSSHLCTCDGDICKTCCWIAVWLRHLFICLGVLFALPSVPLMGKSSRCGPAQWSHAFLPLICGFGLQPPPGHVAHVKSKKKTTKKAKCVHVQQSVERPVTSAHDATVTAVQQPGHNEAAEEQQLSNCRRFLSATTAGLQHSDPFSSFRRWVCDMCKLVLWLWKFQSLNYFIYI